MQTTHQPRGGRNLLKSASAVLAAFVAVAVVTTIVDQFFHTIGVYPPWGVPMMDIDDNMLALAYRMIFGVAGGYIAARLAPRAPVGHALAVGAIGTVLSALGAWAMWDMALNWYPVLLALSSLPTAWLGGRLYARRSPRGARA